MTLHLFIIEVIVIWVNSFLKCQLLNNLLITSINYDVYEVSYKEIMFNIKCEHCHNKLIALLPLTCLVYVAFTENYNGILNFF